jgi:Uma2 family endonuclease
LDRKLQDYFTAGVSLVWYVDPVGRIVQVYTAVDQTTVVREDQQLIGDPLLPGFVLPLADLFAQLES